MYEFVDDPRDGQAGPAEVPFAWGTGVGGRDRSRGVGGGGGDGGVEVWGVRCKV